MTKSVKTWPVSTNIERIFFNVYPDGDFKFITLNEFHEFHENSMNSMMIYIARTSNSSVVDSNLLRPIPPTQSVKAITWMYGKAQSKMVRHNPK